MSEFLIYAPVVLVIIHFIISWNLFVTPNQMQEERKLLLEEVERRFLSIVAFREFEKRIDEHFKTTDRRFSESSTRFDKVDASLAHITDILISDRKIK